MFNRYVLLDDVLRESLIGVVYGYIVRCNDVF